MSTVDKALSVLDLFSESHPNMGLSEIARKLGWDKSNVQRYVSDLTSRGILEQDSRDKSYYLGPALTRLAMVRDRTHPIAHEVQRVLAELVRETGETAHTSRFVNGELMTSAVVETMIRGTRVYIDPAAPLPFHATGSGVAFLSASPKTLVERILSADFAKFTPQTPTDKTEIFHQIQTAKEVGYSKMAGSYENDVVGIAAPIVGFDDYGIGAIAVATPTARFNSAVESRIASKVKAAAHILSQMHGAS